MLTFHFLYNFLYLNAEYVALVIVFSETMNNFSLAKIL